MIYDEKFMSFELKNVLSEIYVFLIELSFYFDE